MPSKKQRLAGIVITALVTAAFAASALGKLVGADAVKQNVGSIGIPFEKVFTIGVLEIASALVFAIPRTSFLGAILLTGYSGGAIFAHFRAGVGSPVAAIVLAVLAWVGYGLRNPEVIRRAFGLEQRP